MFLRHFLGVDGVHKRRHGAIRRIGDGAEQFGLALGDMVVVDRLFGRHRRLRKDKKITSS